MTRGKLLVRPEWTTTPSSGITPTDWLPVQAEAQRSATRVFDVRAYGDTVTAPSAALQSAIDEASAFGGGTVAIPAGHYNMELPVTLKDNVRLELAPGAVMDFTNMAGHINNAAIYGSGEMVPLPSLASTHNQGNYTLTFASAHGLSAGDVVMLYNPADYSFSNVRNYYRQGEFVRVAWVESSTAVRLTSTTQTSSSTSVEVYKIDPIRTGVSGGQFKFKWMAAGIRVRCGVDLTFENLNLEGSIMNQLWIDRCYNVTVSDVHAREFNDPYMSTNTHYGIIVGNSQNVFLDHCMLESGRHGLTTGGDPNVGCVPCRNIQVSNSYITGWGLGDGTAPVSVSGLALHGNIEYFQVTDCILPAGFAVGGNHITIDNCEIGSNLYGNIIRGREMSGADVRITNNRIKATRNCVARSFVEIEWQFVATAIEDTFEFSNNTVDLGPYVSTDTMTVAVSINNSAGNLPVGNYLNIANNTIRTSRGSAPHRMQALLVRGGFKEAAIENLKTNMAVRVTAFSGRQLKLSDIAIRESVDEGVLIDVAVSVYTRPDVILDSVHAIRVQGCGMEIIGATNWTLYMSGCISKDANLGSTATGSRSSSMFITGFQSVFRKDCLVGGGGSAPPQAYVDVITNVLRLSDIQTINVGSTLTANVRSGITTQRVVDVPALA